jgi:hypothetical protein
MLFCDDLWIEIKKYVFNRHLWNIPIIETYNLVLNEMPKIRSCSFMKRYAYAPYISIMKKYNKSFYILTDSFSWRNNIFFLVNYVMADDNNRLFYDYDMYPSIQPLKSIE